MVTCVSRGILRLWQRVEWDMRGYLVKYVLPFGMCVACVSVEKAGQRGMVCSGMHGMKQSGAEMQVRDGDSTPEGIFAKFKFGKRPICFLIPLILSKHTLTGASREVGGSVCFPLSKVKVQSP